MELSGTVTNIKYRNDDNGWTVLTLENKEGEQVIAVGAMPGVNVGETVVCNGSWSEHPLYGPQLKVSSFRIELPTSVDQVMAYLSSGFIKGIGRSTARLLVDRFGAETLDIIRDSPKELLKISGIGPKKLKTITESYREKIGM